MWKGRLCFFPLQNDSYKTEPCHSLKTRASSCSFLTLISSKRHRFCVPALGKLPLVFVQLLSTFRKECFSLSAAPRVHIVFKLKGSVAFDQGY